MKQRFKYQVVTDISSRADAPLDWLGRQILAESNNFRTARRECIEWAAYDDILVEVVPTFSTGRSGGARFSCDGAGEAFDRYPKTAANQ